MSVKAYLFGFGISSLLCWFAFGLTLVNTNPTQGSAALASLYLSLFFALLGTLTLLGYFARVYRRRNEIKYANIQIAFRQATLTCLVLVGLLALQSIRLLAWWDILLLVVLATLLELYLRSNARSLRV